jgi:hypothetical protein
VSLTGRILTKEVRLGRSPRAGRDPRKGRRLELLCTLRRAREELGRWPSFGEWEFASREHVSRAPIRGSSAAGAGTA